MEGVGCQDICGAPTVHESGIGEGEGTVWYMYVLYVNVKHIECAHEIISESASLHTNAARYCIL